MAKSKLVKVNEKIAENVVGGYKKIEETVVGGYKKIEDGVVGGFNRMSGHFVDQFLTKEGETVEQAKQRGFQAGIDDYMVKPIDLDELLLRMEALLRRARIASSKKLTVGGLTLDAEEHTAYLNGEEIPLTVREFNLIYKLLSYPKKTFTRSQLMDEFWDSASTSGPRTVDVYMVKLREKFADCADFEIVTVHGLGYKAVLK